MDRVSSFHIPKDFPPFHQVVDSSYKEEKARYIANFVQSQGFHGEEMLMDLDSCIVDTSIAFAVNIITFYERDSSWDNDGSLNDEEYELFLEGLAIKDFSQLVKVEQGEDGEWRGIE